MKRVPFTHIFEILNGGLRIRKRIIVHGVIGHPGQYLPSGTSLGGINFHLFQDKNIAMHGIHVEGFFHLVQK